MELEESSMKPAEKREAGVVVVVVVVVVEKRRKKHNKKRKQNCARGESFRCPPLPSTTTTTTTTTKSYNCTFQLTATQLLIHNQFTMFKSLRLAPRLNVLRPVVRWNSSASPASPPLMAKIRTDLKTAMRAKDTSRYVLLYIYIAIDGNVNRHA